LCVSSSYVEIQYKKKCNCKTGLENLRVFRQWKLWVHHQYNNLVLLPALKFQASFWCRLSCLRNTKRKMWYSIILYLLKNGISWEDQNFLLTALVFIIRLQYRFTFHFVFDINVLRRHPFCIFFTNLNFYYLINAFHCVVFHCHDCKYSHYADLMISHLEFSLSKKVNKRNFFTVKGRIHEVTNTYALMDEKALICSITYV